MTDSTNRKKVLYVITKSNFGGAQRYVFDLARHLPADRFVASVACGGNGLLVERLRDAGIVTHEVRHFTRDVSLLADIRAGIELIRLFRRERPDTVHLNSAKPVTMGALAARIARVPRIVSTIHGWTSHERRPRWQHVVIRALERFGMLLAHETIVVCAHDARPGTTTIHNGILPPDRLPREEARHRLGIPTDAFVVGSIGELTPNKGFANLVEAAGRSNAVVVIIGDGEEHESLEARARGVVRFAGYIPDAASYLSAFDAFALPSWKEGLPYVLLEAGMASLPAIATRVGGIPEIVEDGASGTLVAPGDSEALARAIERYRTEPDLAAAHGAALYAHVSTNFTLERMVQETVTRY